MSFHRYVALGDSFTEGVGDVDPTLPNGVRGWADRVAEVLATRSDDFGYANLAIRGRKLEPILAEQLEPALALAPDLVTIYAGANDILRPKVDLEQLASSYDKAIELLAGTGAQVVMFTPFDPGHSRTHKPFRGRWALYAEHVREIADRHGAAIVDFWRMRELRDPSFWADDRLHLNERGHQHMAIAVLDRLGIAHDLEDLAVGPPPRIDLRTNVEWARTHAFPWIHRRLTGTSSGDSLTPRHPTLAPIQPPGGVG